MMTPKRVGIVGYGHLGKYLFEQLQFLENVDIAFVWNRTEESLQGKVPSSLICKNLDNFASFQPDLVVEVSHPCITEKFGTKFLEHCDYLVGSPTAFSSQEVEGALRRAASMHGLYVPAGALWGGEDIKKMADRGSLKGLKITMKKHPSSFKLTDPSMQEKCDNVNGSAVILYDGSVRDLCPLAPNNVNTMAAAALCAHNLGFDEVQGCLVADPSLRDWHIVEVEATGPSMNGLPFTVHTVRKNPANPGAVTGSLTYGAFLSSILGAGNKGPGVHSC